MFLLADCKGLKGSRRKTTALLMSGAVIMITSHAVLADDRPLLIDIHRSAGLKCTQCHQEQPPKLTPPSTTCIRCHGSQQSLADKTRDAFPNPHASPHLPAGQISICSECHHVHRPSEVSCSACHREFYFNVK